MRLLFFLAFLATIGSCGVPRTEVSICSTIHGLHKTNENYSYDDLFSYIDDYDPDIIGIEIRQEDIDSSTTYLRNFYPYEMHQILERYSSTMIYGIDWLGSDIEGKAIPQDYFRNLDIISLQVQANEDSTFQLSLAEVNELADQKDRIASTSSISALNDGRYDSLNTIYYRLFDSIYAGSPYSKVASFYSLRDQYITDRILEIISENRGKKILFLTGADHRSRSVNAFKEQFGDDSKMVFDNF